MRGCFRYFRVEQNINEMFVRSYHIPLILADVTKRAHIFTEYPLLILLVSLLIYLVSVIFFINLWLLQYDWFQIHRENQSVTVISSIMNFYTKCICLLKYATRGQPSVKC